MPNTSALHTARCTLGFPTLQDAPAIWSAIRAREFRDILNLAQADSLAEIQRRVAIMCAESVWAGAATTNTASLRVMDKLGMVRKTTNPAGYELRGQPIETHESEITAAEWRARSQAR